MNIFRHYPALAPPCNCGRGRDRRCKIAGGRNVDSKFRDSHISGNDLSTETRVCYTGLLSTARPCGTAPSKYSPSSRRLRTTDVYQSCAKCESRNFESIFRPPAIFHPRTCPCPQLHVSPSHRLRHLTVTKRTVT